MVLTVAVVVLTILAPFVMKWWAPGGMKWEELSNVSQTYGAVSIPLSGAALFGVVWSLVMQARQMKISNEIEYRASHRDLLMRALDDPTYQFCWEPPTAPVTQERYRQQLYAKLIISDWRVEYLNGTAADDTILFWGQNGMASEIMREFWRTRSVLWATEAKTMGPKDRKFVELLDEAMRRAEAAGPAVPPDEYFLPPDGGTS
ncbi:DUF6082 family protein [Streptomyces sp. NPDC059862]|uniref:DUF6082 family protein n=1 Tax=Streptomyces sp. NPDC059862 TaxID=3346975 RepID=UPI003666BAFA